MGSPARSATSCLRGITRPTGSGFARASCGCETRGVPSSTSAYTASRPSCAGARRDFEIGLLYDPRRAGERALARSWQKRLREFAPELRVRRNAPYRGDADGLTTALRRDFGPREYLGLELELNQRALARTGRRLLSALSGLLAGMQLGAEVRLKEC